MSLWFTLLSAVLAYLSFPPANLWPLAFVALVPFLIFCAREGKWWRLLLGSAIAAGVSGTLTISFAPDPFLILTSLGLFLVVFYPLLLLSKRYVPQPFFFFSVAISYFLGQCFMAHFSLLPSYMVLVGLPLGGTIFAGVARIGGIYAASVLVFLVNAAIAYGFFARRKSAYISMSGIVIILLVSSYILSATLPKSNPLPLRAMAVSVGDGFDAQFSDDTLYGDPVGQNPDWQKIQSGIEASLAPIGQKAIEEKSQLVVFPEHMIDLTAENVPDPSAQAALGISSGGPLLAAYADFARQYSIEVFATITAFDSSGRKYTSTIAIDSGGDFVGRNDKHFLTFASDYWPAGLPIPFYWRWEFAILPPAAQAVAYAQLDPANNITAGSWPTALINIGGQKIGTLICLEEQLPQVFSAEKKNGADLLALSANDEWVSIGTSLYENLSLKEAALAAIANQVPIVRAVKGAAPSIVLSNGNTVRGTDPALDSWTALAQ